MPENSTEASDAWNIASRWCADKGEGWSPICQLGLGGTAPVFEVQSPLGPRALKIYDEEFSSGKMGEIEHSRIEQQLSLKDHNCSSLVHVYEGGMAEDRLYLLMSRAPGVELAKHLADVPRSQIRTILGDVAQACIFLEARGLCHRDIKAENVFVSDDFSHATLLDVSVLRAIHDPVGVGSDRDGQLPVLATARYSPPEYLFRLVKPGPSLWHALNIYQMGALLHDLITRTSLFQAEYEQSMSNRYRFAWVVATQEPCINAPDVDDDLVLLARRALDKNWERRSALQLQDFLDDPTNRQQQALQMLGLHRGPNIQVPSNINENRIHLVEISGALKAHLVGYFQRANIRTVHRVFPDPGDDNSHTIELRWDAENDLGATVKVTLCCTLRLNVIDTGNQFSMSMKLSKQESGTSKSSDMVLPDLPDDEHSLPKLTSQSESAFASLAEDLLQPDDIKS
jgi:serine/threonine protein kinase